MKKFMLTQAVLDVIKFTVAPAGARVITLDGFTAPCGGVVDWGDGAYSPLATTAALSHTYANTAARQITIRGVLGGFWNTGGSTGKPLVTSLDEISSRSLVTLQNAFRGCTAMHTLPATLEVPNVTNFNYMFYRNRSITGNLTPLWMLYASKAHTGCFTDCCKLYYGQQGTGCPYRDYVSAVPEQTYYQKYGTGCPSSSYVPETPQRQLQFWYHYNCPSLGAAACPYYVNSDGSCWGGANAPYPCKRAGCITYIYWGNPAYYQCNANSLSKVSQCGSGCQRGYSSGQSAYYSCARSGGTCQDASCPYPRFNEASYNNARNNGWA